ncbi:MAG: zinc-binding dehydrogenase [Gemmatimonadetes bacterium]|nr:zinc-binding dehydrogenase [Gemmatimonadota bacterium]NNM04018.1 zinc-binding dehydrogenase [Gemmatimonadota bacterium]
MKAAIFAEHGGPQVVHLDDVPVPDPGPGEVRVAVRAAAMNHLDLWVRRGLPFEIIMPHIGGSDIAGVVDAAGPGVSGVEPGTRVVVDPSLDYGWYDDVPSGPTLPAKEMRLIGEHTQGGFAEYCVVPAENLVEVPDSVSFQDAAAASLVGVTAWRALMVRGGLRTGERVLITGASGGVSTVAIQMARLAGAEVFAVTSGRENVTKARELGAQTVYDRNEVEWGREVFRDTGKRGVDLVLDSVGEAIWPACLKALAVGGRLVTFGATTGAAGATEIRLVFWKQLSVLGSTMGSPADYRNAMNLVFQGKVEPVIHSILPLEETRTAHELLEAGQVFGKIVLTP